MALFKVNRGTSVNLPAVKHDGWAYFCTDTAEFFIDYLDENEVLQRKQINADEAKRLSGYDISNVLDNSDIEIPTSAAVFNAIKNGVVSWNDLQDKPFGDNADGTVNQMSGKYVEGMGYKETKNTIIFSGDVDMVGMDLGEVAFTEGIIPTGLSSIPEEVTITIDGVSTVVVIPGGRFSYNGKNIRADISKGDDGNWNVIQFHHDGNNNYTIEDITIEAATENIHPIDEKYLPNSVKTQPDWFQNDETASDYIKNRPGGYSNFETTEQFNKTISFEYDSSLNSYHASTGFGPYEIGTTYLVVIDGVEYTTVASSTETLGRFYSEDPEPFTFHAIYVEGGYSYGIRLYSIEGDSHHIQVYKLKESITPFETKYITAISESNKGLEQKFWRGTKAEYDAISEKDDATLYIVTDNLAPEENSGEFPSPTLEDEGKVLMVVDGAPAWAEAGDGLPEHTTADNGKFLRIVDGAPAWVTVQNSEEVSF